jgi:hypothetical protein
MDFYVMFTVDIYLAIQFESESSQKAQKDRNISK